MNRPNQLLSFEQLPKEIIEKILFYLQPNELENFSLCCKIFKELVNNDRLW